MIGWKRRSSAPSFSMYLRYSSSVVAPMHCSSPRASAGFSMLEASIAPSAPPAPTIVCSSSMKMMMSSDSRISFMTALSRSSNWPRYFVPATTEARSSVTRRLSVSRSGDLVRDDALRQPLGDGGLADAGLADEDRVVLLAAAEHLDDALDLVLAADDRVELALARQLGQIAPELVRAPGSRSSPRAPARRLRPAVPPRSFRVSSRTFLRSTPELHEHARRDAFALADQAEEQMLGADVVVAEQARLVDRELEHALRARRERDLADRERAARGDTMFSTACADGVRDRGRGSAAPWRRSPRLRARCPRRRCSVPM